MPVDRLQTEAWLLRGISSIPGQLRLRSGSLSFTCTGTGTAWPFQFRKLGREFGQPNFAESVLADEPFELFRWMATDVHAHAPWYYFSGGIKLSHQGRQLRFSFGRPTTGRRGLANAAADWKEAKRMRGRGRLWLDVLTGAAREV